MKVHNVHSRELAAPADRVGTVLDSLGGEDDRLWPRDRWPAMVFELDGPLAVGARGGHGSIRYEIETYEPGRRVVFRFAPGLGLDGTHRLEVEPLGPDGARMTHSLDCRVQPKMIALWPIVRGYHNALVEDILGQAELAATGEPGLPARWPVWLRIANGSEVGLARLRGKLEQRSAARGGTGAWAQASARTEAMDSRRRRLARIGGVVIPATLLAIGALHAAWALGWRWPGGSDSALAERVVGAGSELPPDGASWAVAALLLVAAATVRAAAAGAGGRVRLAAWGVSGVLVARGLIYPPIDIANGLDAVYDRLDLAIYSPLCLALGCGTAWLLRRGSGPVPAHRLSATVRPGGASAPKTRV